MAGGSKMERQNKALITKICYLYYNEDLTQAQIASRLGITRQMVSRLIQKAKHDGIVQILIKAPTLSTTDLEVKLENRFNLQEAILVPGDDVSEESLKEQLGRAAADHLQRALKPGLRIGMGWGTTLRSMAEYFTKSNTRAVEGVEVIQVMGGINNVAYNILAQDIVRLTATSLGGREIYLHAPCIVDNRETRDTFVREGTIREVIERYGDLDVAFIGLGLVTENTMWANSGNIDKSEFRNLQHLGAVGEICLRPFDSRGEFLAVPIADRVISINVEQLRKVKSLAIVGGGKDKHEAMRGVLQSGLAKVVITDEDTARYVLDIPDN
jgi:DNA-binding transcriptional regulator LsrR (DeoR family)